ncbi:asparagine synthetase B family protein [Microbulbifer elongatus]|uniref:Asparagine synthetase B family protein n=1 Tax=Microbulbifer elongatus TaxID=86173 RepID=A0ABT1P2E7_9GAMM|nr:asparagine synthase-related protein [Microbulbifer elongatus]MCQ3830271.1 asparagine synthetase B family protein [Microbulbifer elongatus]
MYRFIALFWDGTLDTSNRHASLIAEKIGAMIPGVEKVLSDPNAAIFYASDDHSVFDCVTEGPLVVLGKAFTKNFGDGVVPEPATFTERSADEICLSHGHTLVQEFWGRYVAFGKNPVKGNWFAMRDPTGEIPCHMITVDGLTVLFSNMEDILKLGLTRFSVNWSYLINALRLPFRDNGQTGFNEVIILDVAESQIIEDGKPVSRICNWDVMQMAYENPITDVEEAVRLARSTLLGCIGALAGQHSYIQLKLSGGLDSSIVLAGLLHAPSRPEIECIHHYDAGIGADEREFARMAVAGACASSGRSCELVEFERQPHCSLEEILDFPRTARLLYCSGHLLHRDVGMGSALNDVATRFTGVGGDAVFLRFKGNGGAIDYAWRHGINPGLLRVALETAQAGDSFYGVMKDAIRYGVQKKPLTVNKRWGSPCDWLRIDAEQSEFQPAWLRHGLDNGIALSPSKITHISRMVFPTNILDPFEGARGWHGVSPISAQPVVELFARIPLYILMADAEDRTIARRAFAGLLPEPILSRKVKCYLDDHAVAVTQHHREFIKDMLVDGILAEKGYINRRLAKSGIQGICPDNASQVLGVFGPQLNVEAWLRKWSSSCADVGLVRN